MAVNESTDTYRHTQANPFNKIQKDREKKTATGKMNFKERVSV